MFKKASVIMGAGVGAGLSGIAGYSLSKGRTTKEKFEDAKKWILAGAIGGSIKGAGIAKRNKANLFTGKR